MPGTSELVRRIKSVRSTRKVTRAMQLISASKMRRAQHATLASRAYTTLAWGLIKKLGGTASFSHSLLATYPHASKVAVVSISANKGLVGGFNSTILQKSLSGDNWGTGEPEYIVFGKKVAAGLARLQKKIIAEYDKYDTTSSEDIYPLVKQIIKLYESKKYNKIILVYTHFISTLVQKATAVQLLPILPDTTDTTPASSLYQFEPNPVAVLNNLLPRIIESQIYQAVLESDASEHSARMIMMKNATDSAGDLLEDLTLTYNQLRQNKITTELSEITAGKIALEG